ncbi:hypothetical protein ACQPZZ_10215 [Microbispora sp. CA-135349]|uniref:hypothetical protein n=1 Tax=Microbispora sp. CA-135349 TaxID=3239953 RepID=UPI003D914C5E
MGEHRGGSRGELKHGALVAATVLLVLALVAAWSVLIPGFMDWDDIVAAVIGSLRLTGPLGAAFAAWVALRRRSAEKGRVLTPWRAARAPLSIIAVVTGSFGATVLLLGLRAALTGQGGPLLPGGLAMSVAGLGLYVVVGWILGWLVPVVVVPLIAGAGTYGLFTWVATGPNWADRLAPATGEPYDLLSGVSESAYTDQTLWLLGLSTALLLGWVALVTRRTLALAAAVIAVLAAGTGAARLVTGPRTMTVSERLVCQEWPISVCVHPALRGGLAELATVFTALAMRLNGTPAAFTRVEQRAYGEQDPAGRGVVVVHLDDLGSGYAQRAATEFLDRLARPCPETAAAGYRAVVVAWLRGVSPPGGPSREHREASVWFSELTEAQRRDWLRMFYSDFVSCRLQAKHFGGGTRPAEPVATGYPVNSAPAYAPHYPVEPTYPGTTVATGMAAGPDTGGEPGMDPLGGGTGPGWTGPSPSVPVWPSPPAASPAGQDPTGRGPMGRGYPDSWGAPSGEGVRRGGPWGPGRGRPRHPWRPGRTGDTAFPGRSGGEGASPSPFPDRPGRPRPGASQSGPMQPGRLQPGGLPAQGTTQGTTQGTAQGTAQGTGNAPGRGRPPGQGGPAIPGGPGGNGRPGGNDGQGRDGGQGVRRAHPERVPGPGAASGRVPGGGGPAGRSPGVGGPAGRSPGGGGRDGHVDGAGGRTDRARPATGDTTGAREADPQDGPGVAGVPGALLAPAA